ncbi:hypothetical protein P8625_16155 [Tenacibaculum tangerinum]|uniref:Outer membrane protein beta-barrel domain-containing protein n=1 Tax=Tenacibaculum tangerinum TaxID=3038772 RepID=A0ABY8L5Y3_9FLAO|nr:hypothetical protein [Tenacibaculum tangerinum]WGH75570.1 hypothetical protein P8625_16155 [Tenacibaculum tangerinum]
MKKLVLCAMLCVLSVAYGQEKVQNEKLTIEKGTYFLNGDFSVNHSNNIIKDFYYGSSYESNIFNFSIAPKIGYAIKDNLLIGLGVGYGYSEVEAINPFNESNATTSFNNFSILPFIKKLFPVGEKLTLSIRGEFNYTYTEQNQIYYIDSFDHAESYFVGIRPGISYFLTKAIALEATMGVLGYTYQSYKDTDGDRNSNNFGVNLNSNNLFFGLSYYW